jgi:hypothetical protein
VRGQGFKDWTFEHSQGAFCSSIEGLQGGQEMKLLSMYAHSIIAGEHRNLENSSGNTYSSPALSVGLYRFIPRYKSSDTPFHFVFRASELSCCTPDYPSDAAATHVLLFRSDKRAHQRGLLRHSCFRPLRLQGAPPALGAAVGVLHRERRADPGVRVHGRGEPPLQSSP